MINEERQMQATRVVGRYRRKFVVVNLLNVAVFCMVTIIGGWRALLATIGFAGLMLSLVAFIGWLQDD